MIAKLKLIGLEERYPKQLSGGQQQRVAVARALVINPAILLLDEPFSNLDAKLRESTGIELRRIQRDLGLTSIFVTHDQNEAMAIADKIAVMNGGVIEQLGSATAIYERPATRFVAEFIGRANFLAGSVAQQSKAGARIELAAGLSLTLSDATLPAGAREVDVMVRPENVTLSPDAYPGSLPGEIDIISYQGSTAHVLLRLPNGDLLFIECKGRDASWMRAGARAYASIDERSVTVFARSDSERAPAERASNAARAVSIRREICMPSLLLLRMDNGYDLSLFEELNSRFRFSPRSSCGKDRGIARPFPSSEWNERPSEKD